MTTSITTNDDAYPDEERPVSGASQSDSLREQYSSEEVSELVRVALNRSKGGKNATVSRDELLTIARDFGLDESDLTRASRVIAEKRGERSRGKLAMQGVKIHAVSYLAGVIGLFLVNAIVSPDFWWFAIPAAAYAPVVIVHTYIAKQNPQWAIDLFHGED